MWDKFKLDSTWNCQHNFYKDVGCSICEKKIDQGCKPFDAQKEIQELKQRILILENKNIRF